MWADHYQTSAYAEPAAAPAQETCRAICSFEGQQEGDLSFYEGDIITILAKDDPGWWTGSCNGQTGIFPSNYVEVIDQWNPSGYDGYDAGYQASEQVVQFQPTNPQPVAAMVAAGPPPVPLTLETTGFCIAIYDFEPVEIGDLGFYVGDRIKILSKEQGEWWFGELNGKQGMFPSTYVEEERDSVAAASPVVPVVPQLPAKQEWRQPEEEPEEEDEEWEIEEEPAAAPVAARAFGDPQSYPATPSPAQASALLPSLPAGRLGSAPQTALPALPPSAKATTIPAGRGNALPAASPFTANLKPTNPPSSLPPSFPKSTPSPAPPSNPPPSIPSSAPPKSAPPPPPAGPAPAAPVAPAPMPNTKAGGRGALLSSIEGFSKGKLKRAQTNDRSGPLLTQSKEASAPSGGRGASMGGPLFAGGMPKLKSTNSSMSVGRGAASPAQPKPATAAPAFGRPAPAAAAPSFGRPEPARTLTTEQQTVRTLGPVGVNPRSQACAVVPRSPAPQVAAQAPVASKPPSVASRYPPAAASAPVSSPSPQVLPSSIARGRGGPSAAAQGRGGRGALPTPPSRGPSPSPSPSVGQSPSAASAGQPFNARVGMFSGRGTTAASSPSSAPSTTPTMPRGRAAQQIARNQPSQVSSSSSSSPTPSSAQPAPSSPAVAAEASFAAKLQFYKSLSGK